MTKPANHRRFYEAVGALVLLLLLLCPAAALAGPTYYVDGSNGDDGRTAAQAANPTKPWLTIKKAVTAGGLIGMTAKGVVLDGYTVVVAPGLYMEGVESKRDGLATAPVVLRHPVPQCPERRGGLQYGVPGRIQRDQLFGQRQRDPRQRGLRQCHVRHLRPGRDQPSGLEQHHV